MNWRNDQLTGAPAGAGDPAEILLIGGSGMLGRAWREALDREGAPYRALSRPQINLVDAASVRSAVPAGCRLVINAAAYTQVDKAEQEFEQARLINGIAPGILAEACAKAGATLMHYSTDYVFDGAGSRPYRVDDPIRPVNAYGLSKAEGEEAIRASGCDSLIVRTSWLYAPWGANFVRTMMDLMASREAIRVVDDQRGRPTCAQSLVNASWRLYHANARGTHHVTGGGGGDACTWFDFAREIARLTGSRCRVEPCTTADFPRPAKRPAYSVLDLSAAETIIGPITPWQPQLAAVVERLTVPAA